MMDPITFPLTPEQFAARKAELEKNGVPITGNAGTISKMGVRVEYVYNGSTLTVTVLKKPFLISEKTLVGKINDWFSEPV